MAFPDKAKKPDVALMIGEPAEDETGGDPFDAPKGDMPGSAKAAAAKALFGAFQKKDWEAAGEALSQFIDAHDDDMGDEDPAAEPPAEEEMDSPF